MTGFSVVHVVAKAHLDLGFTDLAGAVERHYREEAFPRALAVAAELRAGRGSERLVWTTGSWILERALADEDTGRADAIRAGVERGDLAWHGLPFTTHTELLDAGLVRTGLGVSAGLDARFGRPRMSAAKLTDVPGHTRGLVPLLAEAGVTFLHVGINPAWPVPEVPPVFRWRAPDGSELVVAYQAGGYGGEVVVPGCREVLAFLHAGDNLGPPTADQVIETHGRLAERFVGAEIRGSTPDAFARALAASGAAGDLPMVTAEIGDPWIFGVGSDPQKLAGYRQALERLDSEPALPVEAQEQARRCLLLVGEHTWGLDQKSWLRDDQRWDRAGLAELRATPEGRHFESSWTEQRSYVEAADEALGIAHREPRPDDTSLEGMASALPSGGSDVGGAAVEGAGWRAGWDPVTGALVALVDLASGRQLADAGYPLGLVTYQSFDEADYRRFYAGLTPTAEDEWWARWDNTKPGIDASGAISGRWTPLESRVTAYSRSADGEALVVVRSRFDPALVDDLGAPAEVESAWTFRQTDRSVELRVSWRDKAANRLPEAIWCSFVPRLLDPDRWIFNKLGQAVSPLDVVARGGRALHAVDRGEGCTYHGADGHLSLDTRDAPLVAPGQPRLLDADPPLPDLAGGLHVLLYDNCWGTNFAMWNEGPASFRFRLDAGPNAQRSS